MRVLRWLDEHLEECYLLATLWIACAVSFLQVVMRYFFKNALAWPEEFNRYLFISYAYIAMGYSVRNSRYTRIDILETIWPKLKKPFSFICDIGFAAFCIYLIKPGISVVRSLQASGQTSSAMRLPMWIVYSSLLVGIFLAIFRMIQKYLLKFLNWRKARKEASEE